jgi:hypothetical protein
LISSTRSAGLVPKAMQSNVVAQNRSMGAVADKASLAINKASDSMYQWVSAVLNLHTLYDLL